MRALVHEIRTEQVTFLAGSLAYHAFVSLLPLLLLLVLVLSALGPLAPTDAVLAVVGAALTDGAAEALFAELQRLSRSRSLSVAGGAVLVWGTLRMFRGIDTAFSDIYETEGANGFVDQLIDGCVVFVAFVGAIVVAASLRGFVPEGSGVLPTLAGRLSLIAGLSVTLLPMYYVFPDTDVTLQEVVPGTVFAAVGLTLFESLFGLYVGWSGTQPDASVVAAVLVFMTWLYVSGLVVLLGAVVNAVLANRSADVAIQPVISGGERRSGEDAASVKRLLRNVDRLTLEAGDAQRTVQAPEFVRTADGFALRWQTDDAGRVIDGTNRAADEASRETNRVADETSRDPADTGRTVAGSDRPADVESHDTGSSRVTDGDAERE